MRHEYTTNDEHLIDVSAVKTDIRVFLSAAEVLALSKLFEQNSVYNRAEELKTIVQEAVLRAKRLGKIPRSIPLEDCSIEIADVVQDFALLRIVLPKKWGIRRETIRWGIALVDPREVSVGDQIEYVADENNAPQLKRFVVFGATLLSCVRYIARSKNIDEKKIKVGENFIYPQDRSLSNA